MVPFFQRNPNLAPLTYCSVPHGHKKSRPKAASLAGCGPVLAGAEHVTAIAHVIVRHEQLTGKSLKVKKAGDALGNIVEHAKLIGKVLGELFLAVPSAAVTLAEIRQIRIAVTGDIQKRPEGLLLVIIEVSVLENA